MENWPTIDSSLLLPPLSILSSSPSLSFPFLLSLSPHGVLYFHSQGFPRLLARWPADPCRSACAWQVDQRALTHTSLGLFTAWGVERGSRALRTFSNSTETGCGGLPGRCGCSAVRSCLVQFREARLWSSRRKGQAGQSVAPWSSAREEKLGACQELP